MKLLSCKIENFGCLHDYSLTFSDKITEIEAENGFGKTTLAAFITAMLYGLPKTTKQKLDENPRKRYTPWQGGGFGGSLDIATEKGEFRIIRSFAARGGDRFLLYDLKTLMTSNAYGENIGETLFGIDAESFEKSVFLPQRGAEISMTGSILTKLSDLLLQSDDDSGYDDAVKRLQEKRKFYELYKGGRGALGQARSDLADCEYQMGECERKLAQSATLKKNAAELADRLVRLNERRRELEGEISKATALKTERERYSHYLSLDAEVKNTEKQLAELERSFPNGMPERADIDKCIESAAGVVQLKRRLAETGATAGAAELEILTNRFGDRPPDEKETAEYTAKAERLAALEAAAQAETKIEMPEKPRRGVKLLAAACALLFVGIVLCFLFLPVGMALTAAGAVALVFAAVAPSYRKKLALYNDSVSEYRRRTEENAEKEKTCEALRAELDAFLSRTSDISRDGAASRDYNAELVRLRADCYRYSSLRRAEAERAEDRAALSRELRERENNISEFLRAYGLPTEYSTPAMLTRLHSQHSERERLKDELTGRRAAVETFAREKQITAPPADCRDDTEALNGELAAVNSDIREYENEASAQTARAEGLAEEGELLTDLKDRRAALLANIEEYERQRDIIDLTVKYLEQAKNNLSGRYLRNMERSFCECFEAVSGKRINEVGISSELKISLDSEGARREAASFSEGQRAAVAVCLRLALVEALYGEERPPLILDDPFVNLDPQKISGAAEMLRRLSERSQIVYLTCHPSRKIILDNGE